jgi:hypothetical protein
MFAKRTRVGLVALAIGLGLTVLVPATAHAAVILYLTQDTWESGTGQTGLPDDGFISWAQNTLGYTVTKQVVSSAFTKAQLQTWITNSNASLVIIGPRNASGNYTDQGINSISTPILSLFPHAVRLDRLKWIVAGGAGVDNAAWTTMSFADPSNAWVAGLGTQFYSYPDNTTGNTRWYAYGNATYAGTGTVIAKRSDDLTGLGIVSWTTGQTLGDGTVLTAPRALFMGPDWATTVGTHPVRFTDYTQDGQYALARVINNLAAGQMTTATANAGAAYTVDLTQSATLDASGSTVAGNGKIAKYEWDVNNDGTYDLSGTTPTQDLSYSYLTGTLQMTPGTHPLTLKVTTNDDIISTAAGQFNLVPEPASLLLLGLGGAVALIRRRRSA